MRLIPVIIMFFIVFSGLIQNGLAQSAKDYYKIAVNYAKEENYSEAVNRFSKAIEADPVYERAYIERAMAHEVLGNTESAAKDWLKAAEINRKKTEYYLNAGQHFFDNAQYSECESALNKAEELSPKTMEIWQLKTQLYLHTDDFLKAHQSATTAADQKRTINNTYWLGVANDSLGTYEEAEANFREILDGNHLFKDAYPALVSVQLKRYEKQTSPYLRTEILNSAFENCNTGLEIFPDNTELYVLRGQAYFLSNEYSKAIDDISKAIAKDPENQSLRFERGEYYRKFGQHQNAINDFNEIIRLNPLSPRAHYFRGLALESTFDHNEALADFEEALRLTPDAHSPQSEEYRKARNRILELNRESQLPVIALHHPVIGSDHLIRVKQDEDSLEINGVIKDESRIRYITINGSNAQFNRNDGNPEFTAVISLDGINRIEIATSDWYDNVTAVAYDILFAEINPPVITVNKPVVNSNGEMTINETLQQIAIEGSISDESHIKLIRAEGVNASFATDRINPAFTVFVEVMNKDRITIEAEDIHGNKQSKTYPIVRVDENQSENGENPMGRTWVVFIENSNYSSFARIDGPPKDVLTMKQALAGYHVDRILHKKNMSKTEMEKFFSIELRDLVRDNGVNSLLVWYAGHGTYLSDIAYWIPVDARRDDEFSFFNINNLKAGMQSYSKFITHTLVVTDACDAGPSFADITRSDDEIKSCNNWELTRLRSSQVLSASGYQQAAGQSPLSQAFAQLLQHQPDACMPIEKVVFEMRDESTLGGKVPRLGVISGMGDENGTFFFMRSQ